VRNHQSQNQAVKNLKLRQKVHRNQVQKKKEPSDTSENGAEKSELKKERKAGKQPKTFPSSVSQTNKLQAKPSFPSLSFVTVTKKVTLTKLVSTSLD